jgi:hypothetical protein
MKFPIVFRILAALNVLAFIALGIASLAMTAKPTGLGLYLIWIHWCATIWLLTSAIAWFFASRHAYHFLYSLALILLIVSGFWINLIWLNDKVFFGGASDRIIATAIPGIMLLYVIFLIAAMVYKPVRSWTPKSFSLIHVGYLAGVLTLVGGGLLGIASVNRLVTEISADQSFPDSHSSVNGMLTIKGSEWIRFDFPEPRLINGLSLGFLPENPEFKSLKYGRLYYTDRKKIDLRKTSSIIVEFKKAGDALRAEFPFINAKRMQLYPLADDQSASNEKELFALQGISPVLVSDWFSESPAVNSYADEGSTEKEEGNGQKISKDNLGKFYEFFFRYSGFSSSSEYMFDYTGDAMTIPAGDPNELDGRIAMYKLNYTDLSYYAYDAIKRFQEFDGYNYEIYLWELSGINLYKSKARAYEFAGNGTRFNQLNPQMIAWVDTYLVPSPDLNILGYRAQDYYDKVFRRMARMAAASYLYISNNDYVNEAEYYKTAAEEQEEFYGPGYLNNRFSPMDLDEFEVKAEGWADCSQFIGFWLRRKIDNTDYKCWASFRKAMLLYDKDWLLQAEANPQSLVVNQIELPEGDEEEIVSEGN